MCGHRGPLSCQPTTGYLLRWCVPAVKELLARYRALGTLHAPVVYCTEVLYCTFDFNRGSGERIDVFWNSPCLCSQSPRLAGLGTIISPHSSFLIPHSSCVKPMQAQGLNPPASRVKPQGIKQRHHHPRQRPRAFEGPPPNPKSPKAKSVPLSLSLSRVGA